MGLKKFDLTVKEKISPFIKTIKVDSDKSILGIKIKKKKAGKYFIYGKGLGSLKLKKNNTLNFGNSGTLARLLIGILSTTPGIQVKLSGDNSLNKRSMKSLMKLMAKFGATFIPKNKFNFPIKLISSDMPVGINYKAGVSAQLKSAVMLAGLNSYGNTSIIETQRSRDHTENILLNNSKVVKIKNNQQKIITIFGKKYLNPIKIDVPNDPSSGAFFSALTLLNKDSSLIIKKLGLNPSRTGFYEILKKQGANIIFKNLKKNNNELQGDVLVKSSNLKPIHASKSYYTNMTDEYPILFVIAALTKGVSSFKGIGDLANKESNRIKEMQKILNQIGVRSKFNGDELKIFGKGIFDARKKTIKVPNKGDHRLCMSTFVLALITGAKSLGAKFEIQK